ncbi:MAG TPA: hypothetical protein DD413_02325 [Ruminococcus sp.]|nr:hypothetical protein [Ruminococcus sp.]
MLLVDISNLAYLRIRRKWKNSLLFFLVLLLSFASAIVSVSVVGSIDRTNAQYRLNTYGEWYFAIPYGYDGDKEWLSKKEWVDGFGIAQSVGTISSSEKTIGFGTIDQTLIDIGHIRLDQGVFPSSDDEIAMEADSLSALGYNYTLGQKITVTVIIPLKTKQSTNDEETALDIVMIKKTYTLCGIIHEYSDLWYLQHNRNFAVLNSAVVSETAAANLLAEADRMFSDNVSVCQPVPQYFIFASEENRDLAEEQLNNYLDAGVLNGNVRDTVASVNTAAYPNHYISDYDDFYMYIIALLTFISILCLEIIQLPSNTHSFSVLKSIGMSKSQLGLMQIFETAILGIPAIMLGLYLGVGLTWLTLRLMFYSGSVPIQVYIPYETLFFILGLWLTAILISRLIIFAFTLHVPMIGRFQMNTAKTKGARLVRSGFIVLLLFVSSASVIFTGMESLRHEYGRKYWSSYPSYTLRKIDKTLLLQSDINAIEEIPGISDAYGLSELYIGLSFNGLSEEDVYLSAAKNNLTNGALPFGMVFLLAINETDWTDVLDFGNNKTAFRNGEFVFISVPDDGKEYPLPKEEAVLHIYGYTNLEKLIFNGSVNNEYKKFLANYNVSTQVMYIQENVLNRSVASIHLPYTVICSEQFLQNLLKTLPEGKKWWTFTTGGKFGYDRAFVMADVNSDDLSTDIVIAEICKNRDILIWNQRQQNLAYVQEGIQLLIMLYFSGACICIIALMILWSNISLETKNEKRSFLIKRCIGMSKHQIYLNIFGKSLLRCLSAFLIGWFVYITWKVFDVIHVYEHLGEGIDFANAFKSVIDGYVKYGCTVGRLIVILLIGLVVPLIIILYSKKDLSKDGDIR